MGKKSVGEEKVVKKQNGREKGREKRKRHESNT
jgi:hypothetical protein